MRDRRRSDPSDPPRDPRLGWWLARTTGAAGLSRTDRERLTASILTAAEPKLGTLRAGDARGSRDARESRTSRAARGSRESRTSRASPASRAKESWWSVAASWARPGLPAALVAGLVLLGLVLTSGGPAGLGLADPLMAMDALLEGVLQEEEIPWITGLDAEAGALLRAAVEFR